MLWRWLNNEFEVIRANVYVLHSVVCRSKYLFVTVNTTIEVRVITKVIYINIKHNMFRLLLGHHHVYLSLLSCWIFAQILIHIFFIFDYKIMWILLSNNVRFVYSLALSRIDIKLN
jgi:hypothetical protein